MIRRVAEVPTPAPATGTTAGTTAGLSIHVASRVEDLVGPLVERLHIPPHDPFQPVIIVVQSRGMQRWLSHQV